MKNGAQNHPGYTRIFKKDAEYEIKVNILIETQVLFL